MLRRVAVLLALLLPFPHRAAALPPETRAFVTTTDFSSGGLRRIDLDTRAVLPGEAPVHTDTRVRWYNGRIYVINRFGQDNIQVVDPATLATVKQFSTGNGSNPADIAFASPSKAYVTLYERAGLLIVNPQSGAALGSVALGAFADADGIPEMDHMELVGPYLFVSLQRLDRAHGFVPTDSSLIAVVDTRADTVFDCDPTLPGTQAILLAAKNPVTPFALDPQSGRLLIGCAGAIGALDGGIEWIDPLQFKSDGLAITESALGGDVGSIAWYLPGHSYAIVSDASFNSSLVSWSATSGTKLATVYSPGGFSLPDLGLDDRDELYVLNSSFTAPGVRVYRAGTDVTLAGPLDVGLPPNQITFDRVSGDVASVPPPGVSLAFSAPRPNPARDAVRFDLALASAGEVEVTVFDLAGRRVRALAAGLRSAGPVALAWDLTDAGGARVAPGLYLVRARVPGAEVTRRLAVVR
jgi:DNA-binding beta-propeller fold protein YncE